MLGHLGNFCTLSSVNYLGLELKEEVSWFDLVLLAFGSVSSLRIGHKYELWNLVLQFVPNIVCFLSSARAVTPFEHA